MGGAGGADGGVSFMSLVLSRVDFGASKAVLEGGGRAAASMTIGGGWLQSTVRMDPVLVPAAAVAAVGADPTAVGANASASASASAVAPALSPAAAAQLRRDQLQLDYNTVRSHRLRDYCRQHDCVLPTDSLYSVIELMHRNDTHKIFIINPETGECSGVVSLVDIARMMVVKEGKEKVQLFEMSSSAGRAVGDMCIRGVPLTQEAVAK